MSTTTGRIVTVETLRVVTPDGTVLQKAGTILRTAYMLAAYWVEKGTHKFVPKRKFKRAAEKQYFAKHN